MLLVTFVALSLLANLRTMLKRKLPAHEIIRAVDCDIMDFNEEYTLSDYYTISEMLTELKSVVAIRSHRTQQGSVRISVSGEVIPGAAQRGCPLYLRCSMPDLMR